jgi:hypothetical protein
MSSEVNPLLSRVPAAVVHCPRNYLQKFLRLLSLVVGKSPDLSQTLLEGGLLVLVAAKGLQKLLLVLGFHDGVVDGVELVVQFLPQDQLSLEFLVVLLRLFLRFGVGCGDLDVFV